MDTSPMDRPLGLTRCRLWSKSADDRGLDRIGFPITRGTVRRQDLVNLSGQAANRECSAQRLQFPPNTYLSTCWMVQRLTSSRLASSRWLTPLDRSTRMYSRCCSVKLGRRPERTALCPRLRLLRDRALSDRVPPPLAEGEHHRELEFAGGRAVSQSSDRDRNCTPARCRPSITCSP